MQLPVSEQSLIEIAALLLLFLSIATVIWPKFTGLVRMIWADFTAGVLAVRTFWRSLKQPPEKQDVSSTSS